MRKILVVQIFSGKILSRRRYSTVAALLRHGWSSEKQKADDDFDNDAMPSSS